MKIVKELKKWINSYHEVESAVEELQLAYDFVKEGVVTEEEVDEIYNKALKLVEDLELKNMLQNEEDQLGAVLKVNAGAGGTESQDWASMLLRMYQRWSENKGYKTTITNWQDGDDAGIKTATLQIEGDMAYGFANLSWDTFRSSGAGGQNVNKVETGVRLHYMYKDPDTGEEQEIVIENTESRSQMGNRENALRLLRSQLYEIELEKRRAAQAKIEAGKKKIEWGSQIRSYVFDDRRVKDHRTNYQTSDVAGVMDGDIDDFIKAYLMQYGGEN